MLGTLPKKQRTSHANNPEVINVKEPTEDVSKRCIGDSDSEQYGGQKICKSHSSKITKHYTSSHRKSSTSSTRKTTSNLQSTEKKTVQPHTDMKAKDERGKNK